MENVWKWESNGIKVTVHILSGLFQFSLPVILIFQTSQWVSTAASIPHSPSCWLCVVMDSESSLVRKVTSHLEGGASQATYGGWFCFCFQSQPTCIPLREEIPTCVREPQVPVGGMAPDWRHHHWSWPWLVPLMMMPSARSRLGRSLKTGLIPDAHRWGPGAVKILWLVVRKLTDTAGGSKFSQWRFILWNCLICLYSF